MAIRKAERARVFAMFDGKCAYCGHALPDRWHVDHLEPVAREINSVVKDNIWRLVSGKPTRPELDVPSNYMPSCPPCNIDKGPYSLEGWRKKLQGTCDSLTRYSPTYRHAIRFGLLAETGATVVFHFERLAATTAEDASHERPDIFRSASQTGSL